MTTSVADFPFTVSELFDAIVNPGTYPHWLIGTRETRSVSEDWPRPNSYFEHSVGVGPFVISDVSTLRTIQRPIMMELLVRARPVFEAVVRFDVATTPSGSRLTMRETPVGAYRFMSVGVQPLIRARNDRSLRRLRAVLQSSSGATAALAGDYH